MRSAGAGVERDGSDGGAAADNESNRAEGRGRQRAGDRGDLASARGGRALLPRHTDLPWGAVDLRRAPGAAPHRAPVAATATERDVTRDGNTGVTPQPDSGY